jgi:ribokinase
MNSRIVVVGSLNADFVINLGRFPLPGETLVGRDFKIFPGGKGANQAYAAARLGGDVTMLGQVGNDVQADFLKNNLASVGVNVSRIGRDPNVSSGIATITIDSNGENEIIIIPGSNGTFGPEPLERNREVIAGAGFVLLQLEVPMPTVLLAAKIAKEAGATVILDPAPARALADELLATVDYLTPNETELGILTAAPAENVTQTFARQKAAKLQERGVKKVIVKMGPQGALLLAGGQEHFWPAIPVKAVDTTAAGDAFNAAFAFALARGLSDIDAGRFATAAAAVSVTRPGAQPSMPTRAEVEKIMAGE